MTTDNATESPAVTVVDIDTFKERLRNVGRWLYDIETECHTAISTVFNTFDLGGRGSRQTFSFEIAWSTTDKEKEGELITGTKTISATGYSRDSVLAMAMEHAGYGLRRENFTIPTPLDPAGDTPEVTELKVRVRQLAANHTSDISKERLNLYLAYLGIEPLPEIRRYTFRVPVHPSVEYTVEAGSEEEALALLQEGQLGPDDAAVEEGLYRRRTTRHDIRYSPRAGDPVLTKSMTIG